MSFTAPHSSPSQGQALMAPYLPRDGGSGGSPYSEGGALYALGLIHTNNGNSIRWRSLWQRSCKLSYSSESTAC
jgi:hypothetical protein